MIRSKLPQSFFYVNAVMFLTRTVDVHVNRLVVALRLEKEQLSDNQRSYGVIDLDEERDRKTKKTPEKGFLKIILDHFVSLLAFEPTGPITQMILSRSSLE